MKKITRNELIRCLYKTKKTQAFLRKNKCLHTFMRQIKIVDEIDVITLYNSIIEDYPASIILRAFVWDKSKEGREYWNNIYKKAVYEQHFI